MTQQQGKGKVSFCIETYHLAQDSVIVVQLKSPLVRHRQQAIYQPSLSSHTFPCQVDLTTRVHVTMTAWLHNSTTHIATTVTCITYIFMHNTHSYMLYKTAKLMLHGSSKSEGLTRYSWLDCPNTTHTYTSDTNTHPVSCLLIYTSGCCWVMKVMPR